LSVITTKSFKSFVFELKRLQKTGQAKIVSTSFSNGFFGAVVQDGKDDDYVYKLSQLSGDERENVLDLVDNLSGKKAPQQVVEVTSVEVQGVVSDVVVETVTKPSVNKKRRTRKGV
jgi:hypothetical protein